MIYKFPFKKVKSGARIIIYGAGDVGADYFKQLQYVDIYDVIAYCDKMWEKKSDFCTTVISPEHAMKLKYDLVVIAASNSAAANSIRDTLISFGCDSDKIIWENELDFSLIDSDSQHKVDYIALQVLQILGIKDISYIEVGANHPVQINNTYLFYKNGYRGYAIDPNPKFIALWKKYRNEDVFINVGVGGEAGEIDFYISNADGLSTFDRNIADNISEIYHNEAIKITQIQKVPVMTLNQIISVYTGGSYPTYMSIDIEGLEYIALKDASLNGNIICSVEIDKADMASMNDLFAQKGYFPYCRTIGDIVYLREEYRERLFTKLEAE